MHTPLTASRIRLATMLQRSLWLSDDHGVRGVGRLLLRITTNGVQRFYFRFNSAGQRRTVALGPYSRIRKVGYLTIEQARRAARELLPYPAQTPVPRLGVGDEKTPGATENPRRRLSTTFLDRARASRSQLTVIGLCDAYAERLEATGKFSAQSVRLTLRRHLGSSELANSPADSASPSEFATLLRQIVAAGHGLTASKVRSYLHSAYAMALKSELDPNAVSDLGAHNIKSNPLAYIPSLSEYKKARDRALSKSELKALWKELHPAEGAIKFTHRFVRLDLLLGGQRCQQLLRVRIENVDLEEDSLVLYDFKGRRQPRLHWLPLIPAARRDVLWFMGNARDLGSDLLFAGKIGGGAVSPFSVTSAVTAISSKLVADKAVSSPFTYGDLRRTAETTLAYLKVTKDIRAQLLSHGLGGVQHRHYDRHAYKDEKIAALLQLQNFLDSLLD